jgi:1,4-dihydroxy-6-naphthoate synthase
LSVDVVRRDLGPELMRAVSAGLRASIQDTLDHEEEAIRYALRFGRGLDVPQGKRFVHMYVNDLTLDMGDVGGRALELLYRCAVSAGAIGEAPATEVV